MPTLTESLGLTQNPFQSYVAEKEPQIDKYIVRPPYHNTLVERAKKFESFVLFGARGAGKSASRLALYRQLWEQVGQKSSPLPITLDVFERILARGLADVSARDYAIEIAYLTIESLLHWLSSMEKSERDTFVEGLNSDERSLAATIVNHYYLDHSETERRISSQQVHKLLNQAWSTRFSAKWNDIIRMVGTVVDAITKKKADADLQMEKHLPALLSRSAMGADTGRFAHTALHKIVEFVRIFGFSGVIVLIDKVDETRLTTNSAELTSQLLFPLLASTPLLEIEGLGLEFFLWDKVQGHYGPAGNFTVRLDKIANATISWDNRYLTELVNQRLQFYSNGKVRSFQDLCADTVEGAAALEQILSTAMHSPRELMRILDTIIREHDNSDAQNAAFLSQGEIVRGINSYCIEWARVLPVKIRRELIRLGEIDFVNADVQSVFRCNANSARSRIHQWIDSGLVMQTGTRSPDGGVGKPAFQYRIVDRRLCRMIEYHLSTGDSYDEDDDGSES